MINSNPYVYIIEDEESISRLVAIYLNKSEINTKCFITAEDALKELENDKFPNLIILDLNLPGMSGFEFLEKFKKKYTTTTPILIVSARDADEDIIKGLGFGADEFVTKPFSPSVLVAKVQANLRREAFTSAKAEEVINFGEYTLLLSSCVLKKGTVKIPLSTKEYQVLEYLIKHAGKILSPENIYSDVWKVKFGDITAVAVYIQRLRKKIEKDIASPEYIITEFGNGYIFNKEKIH
jgi:DNA-binding response OmpR family regulator